MICEYSSEQLESCAKLFVKTFNSSPWNDEWSMERAKKYLKEITDTPRFVGFTLWKSGEVIGVAFCHAVTWWDGDELFIDEFFVSYEYQRHGYGGMIMNSVVEYCENNSLKSISLMTSNHMPSNEFYIRNGFSISAGMRMFYRKI